MNRFTNLVKNSRITIELGGINEQISTGNISIDMLSSQIKEQSFLKEIYY